MFIDGEIQIFSLQKQDATFNLCYVCIVFLYFNYLEPQILVSFFKNKVIGRFSFTENTNLHRDDAARFVVIWFGRVIAIQWVKFWVGFIAEDIHPH